MSLRKEVEWLQTRIDALFQHRHGDNDKAIADLAKRVDHVAARYVSAWRAITALQEQDLRRGPVRTADSEKGSWSHLVGWCPNPAPADTPEAYEIRKRRAQEHPARQPCPMCGGRMLLWPIEHDGAGLWEWVCACGWCAPCPGELGEPITAEDDGAFHGAWQAQQEGG